MGDLPPERTTIARAFTNSSVDFAGPFTTRCTNHRTMKYLKRYAAFFVCLVTRAIHIEAVYDLSVDAFISAFKRFIVRRGIPAVMWSDNATNFVGMKNHLDSKCASLGMIWNFIPPRSPHQGGIWEAAIKLGKKHLLAATKGSINNEDQLSTFLAEIESIMNSRPLYHRRSISNPEEIEILTPGHFLVMSNLLEPDTPDNSNISAFDRQTLQRQIILSFWENWKKDYHRQLQIRSKWKTETENIKVDDIVILKQPSSPCNWPIARVTKVIPDSKGLTRVVEIRCQNSNFKRTVQELVKLPVYSSK